MMLGWMNKAGHRYKQIPQDKHNHWRYHYPTINQTIHTHFSGTQRHAYCRRQKSTNLNKRKSNTIRIILVFLL